MNKWFLFGTILGVVLVAFLYYKLANFNPIDKDDELLRKINELELKIDSLNSQKDSANKKVDNNKKPEEIHWRDFQLDTKCFD